MTFNIVFFLMISILLGLIFYSRIYRKNERNLMLSETSYIDAITKYKNNPIESLKIEVLTTGQEYGRRLGLSNVDLEKMITSDLLRVKK